MGVEQGGPTNRWLARLRVRLARAGNLAALMNPPRPPPMSVVDARRSFCCSGYVAMPHRPSEFEGPARAFTAARSSPRFFSRSRSDLHLYLSYSSEHRQLFQPAVTAVLPCGGSLHLHLRVYRRPCLWSDP